MPEAHFIPRSQGGLGVERNIVCLCRRCHDRFDFGDKDEMTAISDILERHLKKMYPDWDKDKLYYSKYGENDGI